MEQVEHLEETFPVRVAARMSGLKPELIRAWEQRHRAIQPGRSAGGTRLYSRHDVNRLDLLRRVVESGLRIGSVASLNEKQLEAKLALAQDHSGVDAQSRIFEELVDACAGQQSGALRALLDERLAALGPATFAVDVALPFLKRVGDGWEEGTLSVASEHLATAIVRSMLLELIETAPDGRRAPKLVFAGLSSERHDLGLLAAAVVANQGGAEIVFLGADLPEADLLESVTTARAHAVVLGLVCVTNAHERIKSVRKKLPKAVAVWIGGAGIDGLPPIAGVDRIVRFSDLEAYLEELRFPRAGATV